MEERIMAILKAVKSQLCSIIEWTDNTSDTIVYKFPMNGRKIMLGSSLTVRESQVAIFVNNGKIADVFQPGMYKLSTSNLPVLTVLLGLKYGMKSPFQSEVYFVNTKQFTNQKWGTSNPITMRDPEFGMIRIRSFGTYSFRVIEGLDFMKELFGTASKFTTADIVGQLRSKIISGISEVIASSGLSAIDLSSKLREFEERVKKELDDEFKALGLRLMIFDIENVSFPEEVEKALDARASIGVLGGKMNQFTQMQAAHAMREAAQNENSAAGTGMGMGAGMAMSAMMMQQMQQGLQSSHQQQAPVGVQCKKCKSMIGAGAKFCSGCGTAAPAAQVAATFCSACGAQLAAGAKFCSGCGKKQ